MDILTFISIITGSLAWPVTAIVAVFALRNPLVMLLRDIRRVKYRDAEFDFGRAITEVRTEAAQQNGQPPIDEKQLKLAELSPRGAILEAWLELEEVLAVEAAKIGIPRTRAVGVFGKTVHEDPWTFVNALTLAGKLTKSDSDRFEKLRQIRNNAVHVTDDVIRQDDAESFIRLIAELKREI